MNKWNVPKSGWIWKAEQTDAGKPEVLYFRKVLSLQELPVKAPIHLSADSRYRFFVNGLSVAFGPCKGDHQVWYEDEVDIAPFLQVGENVLSAIVVRYSLLQEGNHSVWRTNIPGFYLQGRLHTAEGEQEMIADSSWKYHQAEIEIVSANPYFEPLCITENAAGNTALKGWQTKGYEDMRWQPAHEYFFMQVKKAVSPGNLLQRPIPVMYEKKRRFTNTMCLRQSSFAAEQWNAFLKGKALMIAPHTTEIVELDAGELTTGFLTLSMAAGEGSIVEMLSSESYAYPAAASGWMPLPRKGDRTDFQNGQLYGMTDTYKVAGYGTAEIPEKYEPFWFRSFRFIQLKITTKNQPLSLLRFAYRETGYPLEATARVETSDPELKKIWEISLRTLRRCMHETYEDCPFYEQLQYAMDTRSQILYTYQVSADDRLARRCMEDFHRSLRYDGLTNCCYPTVAVNVIPGFSLYYIMMVHDHMMYFGDRSLVERYCPTIDAILNFFARNLDDRGLVGKIGHVNGSRFWSFIDWTTEWNETSGVPDATLEGPITMESFLYAYALGLAAEMAEYLENSEKAQRYRCRMEQVKQAIRTHCMGENGLFQDGPGVEKYSQHGQVWAVLSETASQELWQPLMKKAFTQRGLAKCSVAMAFYLFRAMEKSGLYAQTQPLWDPWRKMLENHLTTCEEDQLTSRSDCHAWGSVALYELTAVTLGVRPAKPGYKEVLVQPNPGYFTYARGTVATPHGEIQVSWEKTAQGLKRQINAPKGVKLVTE